ncbi:hypothetical protein F2Q68_00027301 [Brassica cretica]|uniref:Uncharacterized protein n=1 Tax=Brassica cretica TaxID=69181 RepID=A0A8S9IKA0_BRACR|nr:hypothetical protein F2Q68_00027301 [Brassica cretica]
MNRTASHLSIVTTSSLPSLEHAADFSTECFISPLSQHPLYPLWSRLWTSLQNVGNRLHLIIVLFKLEMSLNELQDQEHTTLTAAFKSLIHPFAFIFNLRSPAFLMT